MFKIWLDPGRFLASLFSSQFLVILKTQMWALTNHRFFEIMNSNFSPFPTVSYANVRVHYERNLDEEISRGDNGKPETQRKFPFVKFSNSLAFHDVPERHFNFVQVSKS